jgi:flagellar hook-associated protein 3 FlgL
MRITDGMRQGSLVRTLNQLTTRQMDAQTRALTGRQVNKPSDDPAAAAELARIRSSMTLTEAGLRATTTARGDLELAEGVLAEAGDLFTSAHEIAMQGANASLNASQRGELAEQVRQMKAQLVGLANTQGATGFLFAGSKTGTTPFDAAGAFSGDDDVHQVDLGTGPAMTVNVSGARAFTVAGGRDIFADLDALEAALSADDQTAISNTLPGLESAREQLMTARSDAGLKLDRLDTTEDVLNQAKFALAKRDQDTAGADPYQAYSDLTTLGQSLEQAVAVARKILDTTGLVRF